MGISIASPLSDGAGDEKLPNLITGGNPYNQSNNRQDKRKFGNSTYIQLEPPYFSITQTIFYLLTLLLLRVTQRVPTDQFYHNQYLRIVNRISDLVKREFSENGVEICDFR